MLDFCLVGFQKCGTTYLHHLLKQNPHVYLGSGKEKMFFVWNKWFDEPLQKMKTAFYMEETNGRKVGSVEPTYYRNASEFCRYFGNQCKLIFMVRDPADRLYSFYRMAHRNGYGEVEAVYEQLKAESNHKAESGHKDESDHTTGNMFDMYIKGMLDGSIPDKHSAMAQGEYQRWIGEFKQFYNPEQILVLDFEMFVKDPLVGMKVVEDFLEIPHWDYRLDVEANEGKSVPRNEKCFRVLKRLAGVRNNFHYIAEDTFKSKMYNRFYLKVRKLFLKNDAGSKMWDTTRQRIAEYYDAAEKTAGNGV